MMGNQIKSWNVAHVWQKSKLLIAINCVAGLSILFFGYDQGMMGGVNNSKHYIDLMGFGHTEGVNNTPVITNSILQGGIVAVYYLGTLVGALAGGVIGEKFGRIKSIALGAAWAILGATLQCSAQNHIWMIFGKYLLYYCLYGFLMIYSTINKRLGYWNIERYCSGLGYRVCSAHQPRPVYRN
jgi:MFS family permease